jgi:Na+(H+)/acetate symporter ActP
MGMARRTAGRPHVLIQFFIEPSLDRLRNSHLFTTRGPSLQGEVSGGSSI